MSDVYIAYMRYVGCFERSLQHCAAGSGGLKSFAEWLGGSGVVCRYAQDGVVVSSVGYCPGVPSDHVVEGFGGWKNGGFVRNCGGGVDGSDVRSCVDGVDDVQVGAGCDGVDSGSVPFVKLDVRGKHYWRNKAKKASRKSRDQSRKVAVDTALKSHALPEVGFFSACDESIKADLRVSRAKMLIAQNEQRARRALADVDRMNMEKDTRVNEAKFELNRLTVDDKLRKISEARMGGSAQTVISSSITSSPPSLSSGSVSPNSSISVAEEMRLRNAVSSLTLEVEQLKKKQVNEVHDGTFVRREVRGTGVYRVHTEEDEFGYSQWD